MASRSDPSREVVLMAIQTFNKLPSVKQASNGIVEKIVDFFQSSDEVATGDAHGLRMFSRSGDEWRFTEFYINIETPRKKLENSGTCFGDGDMLYVFMSAASGPSHMVHLDTTPEWKVLHQQTYPSISISSTVYDPHLRCLWLTSIQSHEVLRVDADDLSVQFNHTEKKLKAPKRLTINETKMAVFCQTETKKGEILLYRKERSSLTLLNSFRAVGFSGMIGFHNDQLIVSCGVKHDTIQWYSVADAELKKQIINPWLLPREKAKFKVQCGAIYCSSNTLCLQAVLGRFSNQDKKEISAALVICPVVLLKSSMRIREAATSSMMSNSLSKTILPRLIQLPENDSFDDLHNEIDFNENKSKVCTIL